MAAFRHLGLWPRGIFQCPAESNPKSSTELFRQPLVWMPLEYAVAVYWRVKKWRLAINMSSWSQGAPPASIYADFSFFFSEEFDVGQRRYIERDGDDDLNIWLAGEPPKNERKLVCGVDPVQYEVTFFGNEDEGGTQVSTVTERMHFGLFLSHFNYEADNDANLKGTMRYRVDYAFNARPAFYRVNDENKIEYSPNLSFFCQLPTGWVYPAQANQYSYQSAGQFTWTLLGKSFFGDLFASNTLIDQPGESSQADVQIQLEAIEYWTYDPEDGLGPIYDKDTGAQIRPFPNL